MLFTGGRLRPLAILTILALVMSSCATSTPSVRLPSVEETDPASSDWARVVRLRQGVLLEIEHGGGVGVGRLQSVDANRVVLSNDGSSTSIARSSVRLVAVLDDGQRGRYARRGFLVGALAGAANVALNARSSRVVWALMLGAGWGGIGALIGTFVASGDEREIVYENDTL